MASCRKRVFSAALLFTLGLIIWITRVRHSTTVQRKLSQRTFYGMEQVEKEEDLREEPFREPYLVYIYNSKDIRKICPTFTTRYSALLKSLHQIDYVTNDTSKATVFVILLEGSMEECGHLGNLPHWRGGKKHLVIILSYAETILQGTYENPLGESILAKSSFSQSNFDDKVNVLIPTLTTKDNSQLPMMLPIFRRYLLAFDSVYPAAHNTSMNTTLGHLASIDKSLINISCVLRQHSTFHNSDICKNPKYRKNILGNSTFRLVTSPLDSNYLSTVTFQARLTEALQYGSIPIFLGVHTTQLPFHELLDWRRVGLFFSKEMMMDPLQLLKCLKNYDPSEIFEMRRQGRTLWVNYFQNARVILETTLLVLRRNNHERGPIAPTVKSGLHEFKTKRKRKWTLTYQYTTEDFHRLGDPFHDYTSLPFTKPLPPDEAPDAYRIRPKQGNRVPDSFRTYEASRISSEKMTVVILTFQRLKEVLEQVKVIEGMATVEKIICVWNDVSKAPPSALSKSSAKLLVIQAKENNLNNRFLPYDVIETDAVLIMDDDVLPTRQQLDTAFRLWQGERDRLVGFQERWITWSGKAWSYSYGTGMPMYNMMLTPTLLIHKYYLHLYSNVMAAPIREFVREHKNCEDIAMNFLVSHITRKAPLKVGREEAKTLLYEQKGLSKHSNHLQVRGHCVNLFQKVYGYIPLVPISYDATLHNSQTKVKQS